MIDTWLDTLGDIISENPWFAPAVALAAGMLTSVTPCSLSTIPLVIGFVGGMGQDAGRSFRLSLLFAAGTALTFTALGTAASLAGRLMGASSPWWYAFLGVIMILMAFQIWEVFSFIPSTYLSSRNARRGYAGAFAAGVLGGVFSSPCATPVLVALMALAAGQDTLLRGILMFLFYSAGHGVLTVLAGTFTGAVRRIAADERYGAAGRVVKWVLGALVLLTGSYMFHLAFR